MDLFEFANRQLPEESEEEVVEPATQEPIYTVGEITSEIKGCIRSRFGTESIWVKGELSNFKGRNQAGHMYFSLKDSDCVLSCVFFKGANQKTSVELKEGLDVLAFGRIDVYAPHGKYQLIIEEIRPGGIGELFLRFEQLKKKLELEGLFSLERKRPIPVFSKKIGVVTSPTGAVLRDIIHVAHRRCPIGSILVVPVRVQGDGAAQEIVRAIEALNRPEHGIEVLIVGRGGGSIEDLWAFNEEIVARAIAASRIPVISAVGHQTDFTIADFVADVRAATPSQAAEMAVPDVCEMKHRVDLLVRNIARELIQAREMALERLMSLKRSPSLRDPRSVIQNRVQRVDLAVERLIGNLTSKKDKRAERLRRAYDFLRLTPRRLMETRALRFAKATSNLELVSPLGVLSRGYSIIKTKDGKVVKKSGQVNTGDMVSVRLHEGELDCQVKKTSSALS